MAKIEDLVAQIPDERLKKAIGAEVRQLKKNKKFGLVFEEHLPETVRLPNLPVKDGELVAKKREAGNELFRVKSIRKGIATLERAVEGNPLPSETDLDEVPVAELVVVRNFGDPIYPALVPVDRVARGEADRPWHMLINADNFHALQLLLYAYAGKVDVIYIDPPYNSGARDWKYNNNYVDDTDQFRHSKWLSFMNRRLRLAKRLLNPSKSFLVVTIDEKEHLRLGLLLEQLFPGNRIQMVSSQISPSGSARGKEFYRVDEYLFFVYIGDAQINEIPFTEGLCVASQNGNGELPDVRWESLLRSGSGAARSESHLKFYPVYVDPIQAKIVEVGEPLPLGKHPSDVSVPRGLIAVWPMRQDGTEGRWQLSRRSFLTLQVSEHVKIGTINQKTEKVTLKYLPTGLRGKIQRGEVIVTGRDEYGGLELAFAGASSLTGRPKTQWTKSDHSAADHGSSLLRRLIPGQKFPFPKSLYAVEDTLRFVVGTNPDALVLDFFAGSGTTLHATCLMNWRDGGRRRSISVTNNEVGEEQAQALNEQQLFQGDGKYEVVGIANAVAWPRMKAAITGTTPSGSLVPGNYVGSNKNGLGKALADGFDENIEFYRLDFVDPDDVARGDAFKAIVPILWMVTGCRGEREDSKGSTPWFIPKHSPFAVLIQEKQFRAFRTKLAERKDIEWVFLITDSDENFGQMRRTLGRKYECVQLYKSYLENFRINTHDALND
jgi:adenine-specific DNA-methyltransferase